MLIKKSNLLVASLIAIVLVLSFLISRETAHDKKVVAVTQLLSHPALDDVRKGVIQGLKNNGYTEDDNLKVIFANANGDPSLTVPIAQNFQREKPDLVIPITTPSTLGIAKTIKNTPIVFAGVTDPVATGLVKSMQSPGENITGVSDQWPFEKQLEAFLKYFPKTKSIGMLYTVGDDVSQHGVKAMKTATQKNNLYLVLKPISSSQDVYPTAVTLLREVDTIFIGIDAVVNENTASVLKAGEQANKPIFAGDSGSVQKGAILALSVNMLDLGKLAGDIAAKVLDGKKPAEIPVGVVSSGTISANKTIAEKYGLDINKLKADGVQIVE
ncbi:ABC transporter substrate-binding protein [Terasakiella sp. SH-1]|uniref:ABC transporter substrate-binding protein n=1 Tax=Terasakiella sp. SH-1 TaxID=2560057 RepID=UPI00107346E4|nr:ABC transporter substrate-binding protein [Terasakiella sp. SH-1]